VSAHSGTADRDAQEGRSKFQVGSKDGVEQPFQVECL